MQCQQGACCGRGGGDHGGSPPDKGTFFPCLGISFCRSNGSPHNCATYVASAALR